MIKSGPRIRKPNKGYNKNYNNVNVTRLQYVRLYRSGEGYNVYEETKQKKGYYNKNYNNVTKRVYCVTIRSGEEIIMLTKIYT